MAELEPVLVQVLVLEHDDDHAEEEMADDGGGGAVVGAVGRAVEVASNLVVEPAEAEGGAGAAVLVVHWGMGPMEHR